MFAASLSLIVSCSTKTTHAIHASALSREDFSVHITFFLQTVQFIHQGVVRFRQRSPHRPHAEFRVDANLHPFPEG